MIVAGDLEPELFAQSNVHVNLITKIKLEYFNLKVISINSIHIYVSTVYIFKCTNSRTWRERT